MLTAWARRLELDSFESSRDIGHGDVEEAIGAEQREVHQEAHLLAFIFGEGASTGSTRRSRRPRSRRDPESSTSSETKRIPGRHLHPEVNSWSPKVAEFLGFSGPITGQRECRPKASWRREWDSNPRYARAYNGFRDRPVRPLRHPSARDFNVLDSEPPAHWHPIATRAARVAITNPPRLPRQH
jgi:hypothetical protein